MGKDASSTPTVKSAKRVISILEILAENSTGLTFTELTEALNVPKSSLHQLLNTLEETNMIRFDSSMKKYTFGIRFWELAMVHSNQLPISQIAKPFLEQLRNRYDETVQMALLDETDVVYISKMVSSKPVQLVSQEGTRLPAYVTGIGKALLACLSKQQILELYPEPNLPSYTKNTITSRENLINELEVTRDRGYARDLGEYTPGIRCIAVPVLGFNNSPVAAVSLSILEGQISQEYEIFLYKGLLECAKNVSYRLGATDPTAWRNREMVGNS